MRTILEISVIKYDEEKECLIKSLDELSNLCKITDGYELSNPTSRFGWTFFKVWLRPNLLSCINEKFSQFISDFFESRGCNIKLKVVEA